MISLNVSDWVGYNCDEGSPDTAVSLPHNLGEYKFYMNVSKYYICECD